MARSAAAERHLQTLKGRAKRLAKNTFQITDQAWDDLFGDCQSNNVFQNMNDHFPRIKNHTWTSFCQKLEEAASTRQLGGRGTSATKRWEPKDVINALEALERDAKDTAQAVATAGNSARGDSTFGEGPPSKAGDDNDLALFDEDVDMGADLGGDSDRDEYMEVDGLPASMKTSTQRHQTNPRVDNLFRMDHQYKPPANPIPNLEYEDGTKITGRPSTNLVYIPTSPYKNLYREGDFYCIPIFPSRGTISGRVLLNLSTQFLEDLENLLGSGLCITTGRKEWLAKSKRQRRDSMNMVEDQEVIHLHQMIFTMLFAKDTRRMTLTIRPWRLMAGHEDEVFQPLAHDSHRKVIIFLPIDPFQWQDADIAKMYYRLKNAKYYHKDVEIYPSRDESYQSAYKLPDIKAFDDIASDPQTPFEFQFRPNTCFGKGRCSLADDDGDQVFKGTFSSAGFHVHKGKRTDDACKKLVQCTLPGEPVKVFKKSAAGDSDVAEPLPRRSWFHQEFMGTLWDWGELRVFMVGDKIIETLFSHNVDHNVPPQVRVIMFQAEHHFGWIENEEKRLEKKVELDRFCYFQREKLLEKYPKLFDTMHVGVRLDVGISHKGEDCRFFINEASRWTQAAFYMEQWTSSPYDQISKPLGRRFAQLYGGIISESEAENEQWKDNDWENYELIEERMIKLKLNNSKGGTS